MITIKKSIHIKAPVETVFAYFTDPNHLPEIWPSMVEVSNVKRSPDGENHFDWVYKMAGIRFAGHTSTKVITKNKAVSKSEGGIPSSFEWTYEEKGGGTEFMMVAEYEIPTSLLGRLAEPIIRKINDHEADVMLQNLKSRLEVVESANLKEKRAHNSRNEVSGPRR